MKLVNIKNNVRIGVAKVISPKDNPIKLTEKEYEDIKHIDGVKLIEVKPARKKEKLEVE